VKHQEIADRSGVLGHVGFFTAEEDTSMLWNLLVFGLIGLFAGGAARVFYPGRQPMRILATMVLGMVGSVLGGLLSWAFWPEVDGQFSSGALLMSVLGAVVVLVLWASVTYGRRIGGRA
jgi:uncharacterized membrane protein YeaQ/YmgE (transglycosylase-associated protein family)